MKFVPLDLDNPPPFDRDLVCVDVKGKTNPDGTPIPFIGRIKALMQSAHGKEFVWYGSDFYPTHYILPDFSEICVIPEVVVDDTVYQICSVNTTSSDGSLRRDLYYIEFTPNTDSRGKRTTDKCNIAICIDKVYESLLNSMMSKKECITIRQIKERFGNTEIRDITR